MALPVPVERREGKERRSGLDRRESPIGHLRNALQILLDVRTRAADPSVQADLTTVMRRLAFAVADLERNRLSR